MLQDESIRSISEWWGSTGTQRGCHHVQCSICKRTASGTERKKVFENAQLLLQAVNKLVIQRSGGGLMLSQQRIGH